MEKICTDCMFTPYCYDTEFDRYADAMNYDGACDSFITEKEYNERKPCQLGDYFMFNDELLQVNCISYHKDKCIDDFIVYYENTSKDLQYILASKCEFITKEEAEKKLEEMNNEKE